MAIINVTCPYCNSEKKVVCNGYTPTGVQRYLCSECQKTFQLNFIHNASKPGTHEQIINMIKNGLSRRATARILGVSLNTVLRHLKG
ncbi:IS1-like element transposase [Proteus sp. TJ1640]|uniref:IS1-like element transposase n=1 Tax=Proteus sp. TJ1640 TaxID=2050968 RepID=UPI000D68A38A|nr:IS1-like element transposase [Proteus sp. TJ1640]